VVLDGGAVMFISNKDCPVLVVPAGSSSAVYLARLHTSLSSAEICGSYDSIFSSS
jgi:hypothetical protein